jgi:hypothetical protein
MQYIPQPQNRYTYHRWPKKTRTVKILVLEIKVYNVKRYCQCQSQCKKMGLTKIQKKTIAQRL